MCSDGRSQTVANRPKVAIRPDPLLANDHSAQRQSFQQMPIKRLNGARLADQRAVLYDYVTHACSESYRHVSVIRQN